MKRLIPLFFLLAALCVRAAAAASGSPALPVQSEVRLEPRTWQLKDAADKNGRKIDVLFVQPEKPVEFGFDNQRIFVRNACNLINGSYTLSGQKLVFSEMLSTRMLCHNELNLLEQKITSLLLLQAEAETSSGKDPSLTLRFENGDTLVFSEKPTK